MASVSLRKTCSTCVVATCPVIFVSMFMDLTGRARGSATVLGGTGQRRHGPGTITPCARLIAVAATSNKMNVRPIKAFLLRITLRSFEGYKDLRKLALRFCLKNARKSLFLHPTVLEILRLVQFTQTLIVQGNDQNEDSYDDAACCESWRCAESCGRSPSYEIAYRHSANEREYEHAHHAPAHLVRHKFLQKSVDDSDATDNRKAHPEDEGEREQKPSRIGEPD